MCHKFQLNACWHPRKPWCNFGYHYSNDSSDEAKSTCPNRAASKKRLATTRSEHDIDPKRSKDSTHQQEADYISLDLKICLARLGFYDISPGFPDASEIECAYRTATEEGLSDEEQQRKDEAFTTLMRTVNGHLHDV